MDTARDQVISALNSKDTVFIPKPLIVTLGTSESFLLTILIDIDQNSTKNTKNYWFEFPYKQVESEWGLPKKMQQEIKKGLIRTGALEEETKEISKNHNRQFYRINYKRIYDILEA